jgi:NAD(P)-dependent dehydrogenase (short-subunit alcohol dehydrogenase family)
LPLFISFSTNWETRADENLNKNTRGPSALVTGAGQGIGRAIALASAERGAQVIATDLKPPHETVSKIGAVAKAIQLDVTQEDDWRAALLESRGLGAVDIVANNAGYFPNRLIDELDLVTWRKRLLRIWTRTS